MYSEIKCGLCDNVFTPSSGSQKYCVSCKEDGRKIKDRERDKKRSRKRYNYEERVKVCPVCGKSFSTFYKSKIYCGSDFCEQERVRLKSITAEKKRSEKDKIKTIINRNIKREQDLIFIAEYFSDHKYKVIDTTSYINSHKGSIKVICPKGHNWETSFHNFKDNKNRCMTCYLTNNYISSIENKLREYFSTEHPEINVIFNDRTLIAPKELDLYFPDYKVAVEVCGLYWHSETANGVDKDYHYNKMISCRDLGVRLITVFEDEINTKFDIVISRIKQALGLTSHRVYARNCKVSVIDNKTANDFFNQNHIQGPTNSKISFGLFNFDKLVAVCGLGSPTRSHSNTGHTLELKRFCCLKDYTIVGGVGKLLKTSLNYATDNGYDNIKSYCDMRYANIFKPVYETVGFSLLSRTKYTPHYFKNGVRYRNMSLRKTSEERLTGKTELDLRLEQGYHRIWDCGHRTYVFEVNK